MANSPHFGPLPKQHGIGNSAQEIANQSIHEADEANQRFYEEQMYYARSVSLISAGVKEDVARALMNDFVRPGDDSALQEQIKKERVQSELYRAVQGNDLYDTTRGDNKHYRASVNADFLHGQNPEGERSILARMGFKTRKLVRGIGSAIGANNLVESEMERRFGAREDLQTRRLFVAGRIVPDLQQIYDNDPADLDDISNAIVGTGRTLMPATLAASGMTLPAYLLAMSTAMAGLPLSQLERLDGTFITASRAFNDLKLLVDLDQREKNKIGVENVYNPERLRQFWTSLRGVGVTPATPTTGIGFILTNNINKVLVENSLFPLKKNPEGMAFLASIQARFQILVEESPTGLVGITRLENAASELNNELCTIRDNELPRTDTAEANKAQIENITNLGNQIRVNKQKLLKGYSELSGLSAALSTAGLPAKQAADIRNRQTTALGEVTNLEVETQGISNSLVSSLSAVSTTVVAPTVLTSLSTIGLTSDSDLRHLDTVTPPPLMVNYLRIQSANIDNAINNFIPTNYLPLLKKGPAKITPFGLMQRFLRRDYCRTHAVDPLIFSEEADKQSSLMAVLRVQNAQNKDIFRNANRKAAEYYQQGLADRAASKVKSGFNKAQNWVGLEIVNIKEQSADVVLEQIINSDERFGIFKGVNKFSTERDIEAVINKSNKEVSLEVLERFIQTIEEAVSEFKKGNPDKQKFIISGDWDIENLMISLQKFKMARWTREFLDKVEKDTTPGDKEHVFIKMLAEQRKMEQQIAAEIRKEVKNPNAIWKKMLVKSELKQVVDKDNLEALTLLRGKGVAAKQKQIGRLQADLDKIKDNPAKVAEKDKITADINNLKLEIENVEKELSDSKDLFSRVEDAKKHIEENNLSRSDTKKYLAEVGLTGVWDKMGTNFRLQRWWKKIKSGAKTTKEGAKKAWDWSRRKVLNMNNGRKVLSVGRLLASPVTKPIGWAYKVGTFPFRLVGRATLWSLDVPSKIYRTMSDEAMTGYLKEKTFRMEIAINDLNSGIGKLKKDQNLAPFDRDKIRIQKSIIKLELEIEAILKHLSELESEAKKRGIEMPKLGNTVSTQIVKPIVPSVKPANDNSDASKSNKKAA